MDRMENQNPIPNRDEVFRHETHEDLSGFFSQTTISHNMVQRIMRENPSLQRYQGFSAGQIEKFLGSLGLRNRKHHLIYRVSRREMAIPMELTSNRMEMQLIPFDEIKEELQKLKPEVARTMSWIHIGAIQIMIKATFKEGIDSPIDIAICDKRMGNVQDSVLGTISGNLCAGKIVGVIYPRIAYNLADRDFSRALTLHQNFKEKRLMKEGNRPYSITYQISYALSNTHHSELFLRNEFIEIPEVFGKVAQAIYPERIEFPLIQETDIQIEDKPILSRSQSLKLEPRRLSFQGDRITSYRWSKTPMLETRKALKSFSTTGRLMSPEGWKEIEIVFDITSERNQFPCNSMYYLPQPTLGTYKGLITIDKLEVLVTGIPGKGSEQLILGLEFLEEHKPWKRLENGMEFVVDDRVWKIQ